MDKIQLYLAILVFFLIGCQQSGIGQDIPTIAANPDSSTVETASDAQLEVNISSLLKDPNEQIRIMAASLMLSSENPLARQFLIDVLGNSDNSTARKAVCKALMQARSSQQEIKNKEDFIQPLLSIFSTEIEEEVQLAAQAVLIYDYSEIGESLEKLVNDSQLPVQTRKNAISALKLPEISAIIQLYRLVDEPEEQIASEAKQALHSLGFPIGSSLSVRTQYITDLLLKGKDEFLREWVNLQETQIREGNAEREWWQQFSLELLSRAYQNLTDDPEQKGDFLVEYLSNPKAAIKLWALEQVYQWRISSSSNLPRSELESALINLVSNPDKNVRLKTAEILSFISTIRSAQPLLEQLNIEQDQQVKVKLLEALGTAGSEAILQDSDVQISAEIKKVRLLVLEWAEKFLNGDSPEEVRTGAGVIQKILFKGNGFEQDQVNKYLELLLARYEQQINETESTLRANLLDAMASLVMSESAYRATAVGLFKSAFLSGLDDEVNIVRETAVKGLRNIDKAEALDILRDSHINDPSVNIIKMMIDMANDVRSEEDLGWLAEKIGTNPENSKLAWQAIIRILEDSTADNLHDWVEKLTSAGSQYKLTDDQKITLKEMDLTKSTGENREKIHKELAELYYQTRKYEQAAVFFREQCDSAEAIEEKNTILPKLLDSYFRWPNMDLAAELIQNTLAERDLGPDDVIISSIEGFITDISVQAERGEVLQVFGEIPISPDNPRPLWESQLKRLNELLLNTSEPEIEGESEEI